MQGMDENVPASRHAHGGRAVFGRQRGDEAAAVAQGLIAAHQAFEAFGPGPEAAAQAHQTPLPGQIRQVFLKFFFRPARQTRGAQQAVQTHGAGFAGKKFQQFVIAGKGGGIGRAYIFMLLFHVISMGRAMLKKRGKRLRLLPPRG